MEEDRNIAQATVEGEKGPTKLVLMSDSLRNMLPLYRQRPYSVVRNVRTFTLYFLVMFTPIIVFMYLF